MMLVHIEITAGVHVEVKRAVARNQLEHVVEEADSRGDARLSAPSRFSLRRMSVSLSCDEF